MDRQIREEIVAELSLALVSGQVAIDADLTAAWKACRKRLQAPLWKEASLDAPAPGREGRSWLDLLDDKAEHF
jgi:hypothetical protein